MIYICVYVYIYIHTYTYIHIYTICPQPRYDDLQGIQHVKRLRMLSDGAKQKAEVAAYLSPSLSTYIYIYIYIYICYVYIPMYM